MNILNLELLNEVFIKEEREDMLEDIIKEEEEKAVDYKEEVEETDYIVKKEEDDIGLEKEEGVKEGNYERGNDCNK